MSEDLRRLVEDDHTDALMRDDLRHAAAARVEGFDKAAGLAALTAAIAAQGGATATAGLSGTTKIGLVVLVAGGTLALWLGLRGPTESPEPSTVATFDAPKKSERGPSTPSVTTKLELAPAPADEPPSLEATQPDPPMDARPKGSSGRTAKNKAGAPPSEPTPSTQPSAADLLREAKLVAQARRSLTSAPAKTLELTAQGAKEFPHGQLVEEREALAIRALAALDRIDEARQRAQRFLRAHARGPHADAVRKAIE